MKEMRYFYVPEAALGTELPTEEAQHAARVLRLSEGDQVRLLDGQGHVFDARLTLVSPKHCLYEIIQERAEPKTWRGSIHLAIAPTKMMERMEWLSEKATEIGFDALTFLDCRFSERRTLRTDRIEKIVQAAVKQSRKSWMPRVEGMTAFREFVGRPFQGRKFIAHCYEEFPRIDLFEALQQPTEDPTEDDVLVLIGPEGDFSADEVSYAAQQCGFTSISLGESRLRTETAGLMAVAMAQLTLRNNPPTT